jgi:diacylglycerol kinase (ATP)
VLAIFRAAGVEAESCVTTHAGSAIIQTEEAVSAGCDAVIACGGDGTANEILNGLMHSNADVALGVLPFGSGNLLANDLLLPANVEAAAHLLLAYKPRLLHPGLMLYQDNGSQQHRYFMIAGSAGLSADLMYRTFTKTKGRYGIYAYFLEMLRMGLRPRFPMFNAEWKDEQGQHQSAEVTMVSGVRVSRFPGLLKCVQLGGELVRNDYRLLLFRTDRLRDLINYFASVGSGVNWGVWEIESVYSTWFRCTPLALQEPTSIRFEADGEVLGALPVEVSIDSRTFKLLMPVSASDDRGPV